MIPRIFVIFSSPITANHLVAGLPAAVRALQRVSAMRDNLPTLSQIMLIVPGGMHTSSVYHREMARLMPGNDIEIRTNVPTDQHNGDRSIAGEPLVGSASDAAQNEDMASAAQFHAANDDDILIKQMNDAAGVIIKGTGKAGDGLVSRYINRPISTRISGWLLKFPAIRPIHATAMTAAIAALMVICLFSGSSAGLIAGAILFQAASLIDGVDGEIARATQRSSASGATLDSVIDGITNVAFIAGLAFSLSAQGNQFAVYAGLGGVICLMTGLILLGGQAALLGKPISFDAAKHFIRRNPSRLGDILIWITMRDFFAFASMVIIVLGLGKLLLILMSAVSLAWLLFVIFVLYDSSIGKHVK